MRKRHGGYSGRTTFDFEVERYKDKESGELLREDQLPDVDDDQFEFELVQITLSVSGYSYYDPGRYDGPPEKCYPDAGDTEIEEVVDELGKDWEKLLTKSEKDEILEKITERAADEDDFDPPDPEPCYDYPPY